MRGWSSALRCGLLLAALMASGAAFQAACVSAAQCEVDADCRPITGADSVCTDGTCRRGASIAPDGSAPDGGPLPITASYVARLVVDSNQAPAGSDPRIVAVLPSGIALFFADDGVHGRELWSTAGTPESTHMVVDARPGPGGLAENAPTFAVWKDIAYGFVDDEVHGEELWQSDGTAEGTKLVADERVGFDSWNVFNSGRLQAPLLRTDTGLCFAHANPSTEASFNRSYRLHCVDPRAATKPHFDRYGLRSAFEYQGFAVYGVLSSTDAGEGDLRATDGTGDALISNAFTLGFGVATTNDAVLSRELTGQNDIEPAFLGSVNVAPVTKEYCSVPGCSGLVGRPIRAGDRALFVRDRDDAGQDAGSVRDVALSDGTLAGTVGIGAAVPSQSLPLSAKIRDRYLYALRDSTATTLFSTTATADDAGTIVAEAVLTLPPSNALTTSRELAVLDDHAFFFSTRGPGLSELWSSDGLPPEKGIGTRIVHTLQGNVRGEFWPLSPGHGAFSCQLSDGTYELCLTDGVSADPTFERIGSGAANAGAPLGARPLLVGAQVYNVEGSDLVRRDLVTGVTARLPIGVGDLSGYQATGNLVAFEAGVAFIATNYSAQPATYLLVRESDGQLVAGPAAGSNSLAIAGDTCIFTTPPGPGGVPGSSLAAWRGSGAAVPLATDEVGYLLALSSYGPAAYALYRNDPSVGSSRLFRIDAQQAPRLLNVSNGAAQDFNALYTSPAGLFLSAGAVPESQTLWASHGQVDDLTILGQTGPGTYTFGPDGAAYIERTLLPADAAERTPDDPVEGLYRVTPSGLQLIVRGSVGFSGSASERLVLGINRGDATQTLYALGPSSVLTELAKGRSYSRSRPVRNAAFSDGVGAYFGFDDGNGEQLWRSDGTPGGTTRLLTIGPEGRGSAPYPIGAHDQDLVFFADDYTHGLELFVASPAP